MEGRRKSFEGKKFFYKKSGGKDFPYTIWKMYRIYFLIETDEGELEIRSAETFDSPEEAAMWVGHYEEEPREYEWELEDEEYVIPEEYDYLENRIAS